MVGKDQLVFDVTDATSIADSDSVGAFVRAGTDGDLISSRDIGGSEHLDVYAALAAGDGTAITQTGGALDVNIASGTVIITPEGIHLEDDAHASGDEGSFSLSIRIDDITADNSALLAGTNGDYQGTFTNASGEMYVKDTDVNNTLVGIDTVLDNILLDTTAILADTNVIAGSVHNEDDVHTSGDAGIQSLSVRIDDLDAPPAGTLADTEGDYQSLHTDARGALYVNVDNAISVDDVALANVAIAAGATTLAVAGTAQDIIAAPLANRKYVWIRNNDNKKVFIGQSGVTAANGFPLSPGSVLHMRAGSAIDIEYVGQTGATPEIRTLELS